VVNTLLRQRVRRGEAAADETAAGCDWKGSAVKFSLLMIYDCVILFNELEVLELRFSELDSVVDRFVVVEAPVTFSGRRKPLAYSQNRQRFRRWTDRIIHIVVEDMPLGSDPWSRERHQRNAVMRGLTDAGPTDGIILSDVDEIPNPSAIRGWSPSLGLRRFEQLFCYYWLNCVGGFCTGSCILPKDHFEKYGEPQTIRHTECQALTEGGWHFSYLGGPPQIIAKLEAYSHQDLNVARFKDRRYIDQVTSLGIDLFGRPGMSFSFCQVDERFPACVLANRSKYSHLIREAKFHENWYADDQVLRICDLLAGVRSLPGAAIEIGCWEGKSTVALAHACHPEPLIAIDNWEGNLDESPGHGSVHLARQRDIYGQFLVNIQLLTKGNVKPVRTDCHEFLRKWHGPIKFAHIDASANYASVKSMLAALLPWMVPGGVLCGDDILTASIGRQDLDGGVERAVREMLPKWRQVHNLWLWRKAS
jgi:beta-1,4-mannosyl-glycoprotein beta-1,4-N-acetylglucosaminyltransferase